MISIRFDEALLPLLTYSLIKRDPETGALSLHRLIQSGFIDWLGRDKAYDSFLSAVKILHLYFPKQAKGVGMRKEWKSCNEAMSHVLALNSCYRQNRWPARNPGDYDAFLELINSCGW
jgi:hypothetical protein